MSYHQCVMKASGPRRKLQVLNYCTHHIRKHALNRRDTWYQSLMFGTTHFLFLFFWINLVKLKSEFNLKSGLQWNDKMKLPDNVRLEAFNTKLHCNLLGSISYAHAYSSPHKNINKLCTYISVISRISLLCKYLTTSHYNYVSIHKR
jgi:hypothetical protein